MRHKRSTRTRRNTTHNAQPTRNTHATHATYTQHFTQTRTHTQTHTIHTNTRYASIYLACVLRVSCACVVCIMRISLSCVYQWVCIMRISCVSCVCCLYIVFYTPSPSYPPLPTPLSLFTVFPLCLSLSPLSVYYHSIKTCFSKKFKKKKKQ